MTEDENSDGSVSMDTDVGPSGPTNEGQEPDMGEDFGDYDANIVQLSDTEENGVPYDDIVDEYEEGDVDAFIYAGDASKKMMDPASYLGQFEDTYQDLSQIQDELGAEILVEPGNHAPIKGAHNAGGWTGAADDEEYVEQVEEILGEHYDEFEEFDGNAFEFLADEYDLTNIEYDSVEVGDLTVVGGTHHDGELDIEREWLEDAPELEDLDYDPEELADEIEVDVTYDGIFSNVPIVGTVIDYLMGTENPDPEDVSLEDLPEDYETTGKHEDYEHAMDLLDHFESEIKAAENDVLMTHHGVISSMGGEFGSKVADYVTEEYSDSLAAVTGGHTGTAGVEKHYDVPALNTNDGAVWELGFNENELYHSDGVVAPNSPDSDEGPSPRELVGAMESVGGPDEFYNQVVEPRVESRADDQGLDDQEIEEIKQQRKELLEQLWENRDQIQQTQQPQATSTPGNDGAEQAEA